jgi:formylglycine-generating enzyme required for sulfatase activity
MDKQKHLDDLFRNAKEQNPVVTFSETMERFLTSVETNSFKSNGKKGSFLLTKKLIIMIVTVSTLIIALFFSNNQPENRPISKTSSNVPLETMKKSVIIENIEVHSTHPEFELVESLPNFTHIFPEAYQFFTASIDTLKVQENVNLIKANIPIFNDEYVFPKLTEEEIKTNNKQKKLMLKNLEKFDKKVYAYIPTGTFDYQGKQVSVQSFYMQKTEISNLEYRTFLFDLLIQGRKDEFLKARPDYKQWSILQKQENSPMEQHYFSHPAYDHFPVVNVSREGAEMYCVWLTKEMVISVEDKKKSEYNDVRIPVREEWVMAASSGGTKYPYPWGGQPDRLIKDAQVYANYAQVKNTINEIANKLDVTTSVTAYLQNDYGLFNMSGNAAEMVYDDIKLKTAGTAGGGWMSTADEIKIEALDKYSGITNPHPCIGFRVVMTVK